MAPTTEMMAEATPIQLSTRGTLSARPQPCPSPVRAARSPNRVERPPRLANHGGAATFGHRGAGTVPAGCGRPGARDGIFPVLKRRSIRAKMAALVVIPLV